MPLFFDEILHPLQNLDIANFYTKYSTAIDMTIAFFIFSGITNYVIAKRYEGKAGKAITIGISFALSISFMLTENAFNFSLNSFGPVALFIFLLLVAVVLFNFLKNLGMQKTNAVCLTFFVLFLSIQLITPKISDWIANELAFVNLLLGIFFLFALGKLAYSTFAYFSSEKKQHFLEPENINEILKSNLNDTKEMEMIGNEIGETTVHDLKTSDDIIRYLEGIISTIKRSDKSINFNQELIERLIILLKNQHYTVGNIEYIGSHFQKFREEHKNDLHDLKILSKEFLPSAKKEVLKKIKIKTMLFTVEDKIVNMKNEIKILVNEFNKNIASSINFIKIGYKPDDCIVLLTNALTIEKKLHKIFLDMKVLEKDIFEVISLNQEK